MAGSDEFQAGDVVELKSGSPDMTIESVENGAQGSVMVWCVWSHFDSVNGRKIYRESMSTAVLKHVRRS